MMPGNGAILGKATEKHQRAFHHPVINTVCMLPEQEDVEWHSDRIPLSADPNGLEDTRVSQLAADQVVLKHTWLLNADAHVKQ